MNKETQELRPGFAVLGHPSSYEHLGDLFVHAQANFSREKLTKYRATLERFFEWTPTYAAKNPLVLRLPNGQEVVGRLIICTFLPEMLDSPRHMLKAYQKIREGCSLAKALGARVIGLGGFTSIIGGTQGEKEAEELQIAVTSGNSLTAALALSQLDIVLNRLDWKLSERTVAIVGASGDIGRACALALAPKAKHLLLLARTKVKLEALREDLGDDVETYVSTNIQDAICASIIITATSAPQPLLTEADLHSGTLVCDISYPKTLSYLPKPRTDVLVFSAGLAEMPCSLDMTYYTQLPAANLMYGCFSETMIMALSGRYESYSIGQGRITLEKMDTILSLAQTYGFRPAPLYRGMHLIDDEALTNFLQSSYQLKENV